MRNLKVLTPMNNDTQHQVREQVWRISPGCVEAQYTPSRLSHFKGNPLIEALPASMTNSQLGKAMTVIPIYADEQRSWSAEDRLQMLRQLSHFMIPLGRHVELARAIDTMMREGYVGRAPRTIEQSQRLQNAYGKMGHASNDRDAILAGSPQLSTLLRGMPGMGKTAATKLLLAQMPQVIYHPKLHIYQITYLHVEMPSDGSSIKGLAHGILQQIDRLIPGANYYETYALRGKPGADTLMRSVARVMNMHFVGILVADEIQNLTNAKKGKDTVMTELVSACNELGVPILFIGTNKAARLFTTDFRQTRRASGNGLGYWGQIANPFNKHETNNEGEESVGGGESEWDIFIDVLFGLQWVKKPVPLTPLLSELFYDLSQGVIDLAIKIFASTQARAILDKSEVITYELVLDVYDSEFKLLHGMLDALRKNDYVRLAQFEDISPHGIEDMLQNVATRMKGVSSAAFEIKPGDPTFSPRLAASLVAIGHQEDTALEVAKKVESSGKVSNLQEGTEAAIKELKAVRPISKKQSAKNTVQDEKNDEAYLLTRPQDYRNAVMRSRKESNKVYEQLHKLGLVKPLAQILELA